MEQQREAKKIFWYTLAFMAFSTVWAFGNIVNGYSEFGGLKSIFSWILIFVIYFIPYSLIVGELGSTFKDAGGGVSSWLKSTHGKLLAYYTGWTMWVVHMPYISQKPSRIIAAFSWAVFRDNRISKMNITYLQIASLIIFIIALFLAARGISFINKMAALAGSSMFIMSLLFIVMAIAAPKITGAKTFNIDWSLDTFMPTFDIKYITSIAILVFAVGGCEKISPYVNKMKDPAKGFPKGMIALVIMVCSTAILGTFALALMFDTNNIPKDLLTNGTYYAFQTLGNYYGVGNLFVVIYAIVEFIGQVSVVIISIDAPLRMLLSSADEKYIPKKLLVKNAKDVYTNGLKLVGVIVSILIIIPMFGIKEVNDLFRWLVKLNAVCMPLRYLWVFVAYIFLKRAADKFNAEYKFVKNKYVGMFLGGWCFFLTAFACITGMYIPESMFQTTMNIVTPIVLLALGLIMPMLAKKNK